MQTTACTKWFIDVQYDGQSVKEYFTKRQTKTYGKEIENDKAHGSKHNGVTEHDNRKC